MEDEKINFSSENFSGVHDLIMKALIDANRNNMPSYGSDPVNAVFVRMPKMLHEKMQETATFYWWNEEESEARFIFSFNNTLEDVRRFGEKLRLLV
jgi:threonine aldolase